jgi:flavorubredoxin
MPRIDYVHCWNCGGHRDDVGPLSHTRLCLNCSQRILQENIEGIASGHGVAWRRRLAGMSRYVDRMRAQMQEQTH